MSLTRDQQSWEHFGREDPLWAVATEEGRRHGGWDEEAFFAGGRREVDAVFGFLEQAGIAVRPGDALDFGCGAGRLSRALAGRFGRVVGADLSQPMLDVAARLNADRPALTFTRVTSPAGLDAHRGGHDFVLSLIVLQHVTDRAVVRGYLRALASALRPGGVAVVQLPSAVAARIHWHPARVLGRHAPRLLLRGPERYRPYAMSLTALPEAEARAALEHDGARVEHVVDDNRAGSALIASRAYVVVRAP